MTKYLCLFLFICFSTFAHAQTTNEFEVELQRLEHLDEAALQRVEAINAIESSDGVDITTDSVSVGNAATVRNELNPVPTPEKKTAPIPEEVIPEKKARRIRSR